MGKKFSKIDLIEAGTFEQLRKDIESTTTTVDVLKTALETVNTISKEIKKNASSTKKTASGIDPSDPKNLKLLNDEIAKGTTLSKQAAEADKLKTTVKRALTVEEQKHKLVLAAANAESKKVAQLKLAEKNSIEALRAKLSLVTVAWSKLTKEEIENTKRGQRLFQSKKNLTDQIGKLERATGDHRRTVGNYGSALDGLKGKFSGLIGVASQFGLALGGVAVIKGFVTTMQENENAIAGFRTIVSDLSNKEFSNFTDKINEVALKSKKSTIEIAQSFETIAGLNADFADTAEGMGQVSEAVITLAKASKGELQPTAENLVGIMNQFDLAASESNRTINVLAAGQAVGASSIAQSSEAYKNFGAVAKGANISLEESQALIQSLGKFSIFGAEAGTKLRGVTLQLQKANLGYASGQFNINDALEEYNKKSQLKTTAQEKDALAQKVFGAENITAGKILSDNIPLIEKFTQGVTGTSEAQKAAAINSDTLSNKLLELKNGLINVFTTSDTASGGMNILKSAVGFLADNMGGVLRTMTKLIAVFIVYKGVQATLKLKESYQNWKLNSDAIKKTGENLTDAQKGAKGFGGALKGIGLSVAIGLAIELGTALFRIASGAQDAERRVKSMQRGISNGSKIAGNYLDQLTEEVGLNKINQAQMDELIKKEVRKINVMRDKTKTELEAFKQTEGYRQAEAKNAVFRTKEDLMQIAIFGDKKEKLFLLNSALTEYNGYLKEQKIEMIQSNLAAEENNVQITKQTKSTKENTEAIRYETKAIDENVEARKNLFEGMDLDAILSLERERAILAADVALIEAQITLEKAKQNGSNAEIVAAEQKVKEAKIAAINAQLQLDKFKTDNPNEKLKLEQQAELDILSLNVIDKENIEKKNFDNQKKYIDLTNDYLQRSLDDRIAMLQKEVEASQKKEDDLREQANNGNINAQQSIAEQERIRNEAFKNQAKLTQRKAQLEAVTAFFTSYLNAKEAGKTSTEAFAEASLDKITLEAIMATLPTFLKGTEDTGLGGTLDNDGGFHAILHPNERVMTKEQNIGLGGLSNADVVSIVQNSKLTESMSTISSDGWGNLKVLAELNGLKSELSEVRKAIENKPVTDIQLGQITQKTMEIIHSTKQGNRTTRSIFKVK